MRLSQLLEALPQKEVYGDLEVDVGGLAHDSRRVRPGDLFVAIKGLESDGHRFIPQALEKGAVAVVGQDVAALSAQPVTGILVADSRQALAHLAAAFHGYPARRLRVVGVTGTDGKTTTVNLIQAILAAAGHKTGMISSVNALVGDRYYDTGLHVTTPDALEVQGYLAEMAAAGVDYAVLESTSHGLAQHRVTACEYDVAVVTNITHEHLDYHGSYEAYREAKARLFRALATSFRKPDAPKVSVLNADDSSFSYLRDIPADLQLTYGLDTPCEVTAEKIVQELSSVSSSIAFQPPASNLQPPTSSFIAFTACTPAARFEVRSSLLGLYNVYNVLAAIAVGLSQAVPIEAMQEGIAAVTGLTGRMERIDLGQDFIALVDFAHTPNALEQALKAARALTAGEVIVVFGCAGRRDVGKRPMMGEIAGRLAERVVITAEDPRTESLEDIMAQIAAGCQRVGGREGVGYWRIGDRGEAIAFAIDVARPGDVVVVTGKGHERSMCFGTTEYPWSDHQAMREALRQRLGQ